MRRTVAIVLVAAAVGALAGTSVGVALDNGDPTRRTSDVIQVARATPVAAFARTGKRLAPEAVYRNDSPA